MVQSNGIITLIDMGSVKIYDKIKHMEYIKTSQHIPNNLSTDSTISITSSEMWRNEATSVDGNTFVGTEGYISPEMIQCEEVGVECDIWAFGCIAYRLFTGNEAFVNDNLNQMQVFENIKKEKYVLTAIESPHSKNLISGILKQDIKERLTIPKIKEHPFFTDIDFDNILKDK